MAANMRKPLSVATGGLIASEKVPHADEQAQPGPEGTAAQLKAVDLQAPKRRAAIRELQKVDVRYHPEAEAIIVAALRADPSECVRYEAAEAIATLPVCTEKIAKALRTCIDSSSADGNPAELSMRVRNRAATALANCECGLPAMEISPQVRPEYPTAINSSDSDFRRVAGSPPMSNNPLSSLIESNQDISVQTAGWHRLVESEDTGTAHPIANLPVQSDRPKNVLEVFKAARTNL